MEMLVVTIPGANLAEPRGVPVPSTAEALAARSKPSEARGDAPSTTRGCWRVY